MKAYYNEIDRYAAQWLRNLIDAGHIARGDVDERSIVDVRAGDLTGYSQCHFFAGIGGWSLALRLAGWPDDRPVWTGSCPCQPFSAAGKGGGGKDERHLWPHWFRLIRERRPGIVFGENVAAAIGWGWLDAVLSDLEAEGYATGAAVLGAHSIGAPHIRQRLWFVAKSDGADQPQERAGNGAVCEQRQAVGRRAVELARSGAAGGDGLVADHQGDGQQGRARACEYEDGADADRGRAGLVADADGGNARAEGLQRGGQQRQQQEDGGPLLLADAGSEPIRGRCGRDGDEAREIPGEVRQQRLWTDDGAGGATGLVADAGCRARSPGQSGIDRPQEGGRQEDAGPFECSSELGDADQPGSQGRSLDAGEYAGQRAVGTAGIENQLGDTASDEQRRSWLPEEGGGRASAVRRSGPWSDLVWLPCTDGKARPTQRGLFPLASRVSGSLVCVCPKCKAETEIDDLLRIVWRRVDGQGQEQTQVLRPILHGEGIYPQTQVSSGWPVSGAISLQRELLRAMWGDFETASPSQGSRCNQQRSIEHRNLVRDVSLARAHEAAQNFDLRSLWWDVCGEEPSITSEDLLCWMCGDVGAHQCTKAKGSRVGRLRAYGNAIVSQVAAEFIKAAMP